MSPCSLRQASSWLQLPSARKVEKGRNYRNKSVCPLGGGRFVSLKIIDLIGHNLFALLVIHLQAEANKFTLKSE